MFRSVQFVLYIEDFKVLSIQISYEIRIGPHTDVQFKGGVWDYIRRYFRKIYYFSFKLIFIF